MSAQDQALEFLDRTNSIQEKTREQHEGFHKEITDLSQKVEVLKSAVKERIFNVGRPVHNFVGRKAELDELKELMKSEQQCLTLPLASSICGLGGIGKTQLARTVAFKCFYEEDYNAVWIDAETATGLTNSFHKVAQRIGISIYRSIKPDPENIRPLQDIVRDVYDQLRTRKTLIVFDNANKYDDIRLSMPWSHYPSCRSIYVLITSRNSGWKEETREKLKVIELQEFTKEEAVQYVKKVLKITPEEESIESDIEKLTEIMDFFPLGLSQAVAYIYYIRSKNKDFGVKNYIDMFEENKAALYDFQKYDPYKLTIYTTWQITFNAIESDEKLGPKALELIYTMAFIAPHDILLEEFFLREGDDQDHFWEALFLLEQYSITNIENAIASVHRLVRDVLKLWLQRREETQIYLNKVLDIQYLWNFYNLYYKTVASAHVAIFLKEACHFQDIIMDLFGRGKNLSLQILHCLAESDLRSVVEKLLKQFEERSSLSLADYKTQIFRMAIRSGSLSILDYLEQGDLKLLFVGRVFGAWNKGEYLKLRSFLLDIGENCKTFIDTEMYDVTTLAEVGVADFYGDEIRLRTEEDTPLFFASSEGDLELTMILVEFGANVNKATKFKETALHRACEKGHIEVVKYLIENGANMTLARFRFETPLYQAARHHHKDIVSFLLEVAATKEIGSIGRENAFCAAIMKKYLGIARLIVESGIDVNYSDILGRTPLHHAVYSGNTKLVELVTQHGAFINVLDKKRRSPLYDAVERNHPHIARWLLEHGAFVKVAEDDEGDPFHLAAERGSSKILQIFSELGVCCNVQNRYGKTPLHSAADFGRLDAGKKLVEMGADIYIQDNEGHLPLHYAVRANKNKIVKFLKNLMKTEDEDMLNLNQGV